MRAKRLYLIRKRAENKDRYLYFKNFISSLPDEQEKMEKATDVCIDNNLSVGGSADVLICAFMMNEIQKQFSFKGSYD